MESLELVKDCGTFNVALFDTVMLTKEIRDKEKIWLQVMCFCNKDSNGWTGIIMSSTLFTWEEYTLIEDRSH